MSRRRDAEAELILGVDLKPSGNIVSWGGWPDDVHALLKAWNGKHGDHKLSFYRRGIFQCADCGSWCEPATSGVAFLDKRWLCDDCLITRARLCGLPKRGEGS